MGFNNRLLLKLDVESPKVDDFVQVLRGTQETLIAIGRYLEDGSTTGRLSDNVRTTCTLSIKSLKMNSPAEAIVSVPISHQSQFGLEPLEGPLGEQAVELFIDLSNIMAGTTAPEMIDEIINIPEHRVNILKNYIKIIPEDCPLQIGLPELDERYLLDVKSKNLAIELAKREEEDFVHKLEGIEHIVGPVIEARIFEDVYFKIGSKKYTFEDDLVDTIKDVLGKVVSLDAQVIKNSEMKYYVSKIFNLNIVDEWTFSSLMFGDINVDLSHPLSTVVTYEDGGVWFVDKEDLGIIGVGETWNDALENFMFNFQARLIGYADEPDEKLSEDAVVLRDKLRAIVPEWSGVLSHVRQL